MSIEIKMREQGGWVVKLDSEVWACKNREEIKLLIEELMLLKEQYGRLARD